MAWLEQKGDVFRIRFRFGGAKQLLALHTSDAREAKESLAQFEANVRLIERGIVDPPPEDSDLGIYIVSGGKRVSRQLDIERPKRVTLGMMFDSYLADYPRLSKEARTWKTETTHIAHLRRLLDPKQALGEVTTRTLQGYIDARTVEKGKHKKKVSRETVQKELGTFSAVWNKWAVPQGMTSLAAPLKNLIYPKGTSKAPFQVREQIERQIASRKLAPDAQRELWQCLFLTLAEIEEFLDFVRDRKRQAYVYPMFVFAAHTGARRSEIRRSLVTDFDFTAKTVLIREKKKDTSKLETFRTVPMSPRLEDVMKKWFADHPGGANAICTPKKAGMSDHYTTKVFLQAIRKSKWSILPGWHCFRHSFISNCAAKGVDQRLLDHWVGHTTEAMRRRYSHLLPAVSQAALLSVFGQWDQPFALVS
jgi:integrase